MTHIIKIDDKENLNKFIEEHKLEFIEAIREPFQPIIKAYYKTPDGEIYIHEEKIKPLHLGKFNKNTPRFAMESFIKMFAELVDKVSNNESDETLNKAIIRTQHPLLKLRDLIFKKVDEKDADKTTEVVVTGLATKVLVKYKEAKGISSVNTINRIMEIPQMVADPVNELLKSSLLSIKTIAENENSIQNDNEEEIENENE